MKDPMTEPLIIDLSEHPIGVYIKVGKLTYYISREGASDLLVLRATSSLSNKLSIEPRATNSIYIRGIK